MIEESVFNEEKIKNIVYELYGIVVNEVMKLDRGSANIYVLNDKEYILKEFQSSYSKNEIMLEIDIINHLRKDNIPVPEYIKTRNNEYYFEYEGRVVIIQKYIDGFTMKSNSGSYDQMIESADFLGKIVLSLKSFPELPSNDLIECTSKSSILESIDKINKLKNSVSKDSKIYNDLNDKVMMLQDILSNVDLKDIDKLTVMNSHGDYSVLQFIYKDDRINAIIDFASTSRVPIVWEIIRSYSYIDKDAEDGKINIDNLVEYVRTFEKYVKLNINNI